MRAPPSGAVEALRTETPVIVDGRLDEQAWSGATPSRQFYEIHPGDAVTPDVNTEVRLVYDRAHVYVGVRAHDPNPGAIRTRLSRRDQVEQDQDYVEILIDPLNSRRAARFFRVNASGVMADGLFDEEIGWRDLAADFDFESQARIDAAGWTAEFRIPLGSLRYRPGENQQWAFVVYRNMPRESLQVIASAPVPRGSNCVLCYAGNATGISAEGHAESLKFVPYIAYVGNQTARKLRAGMDVKWVARTDTVVDLTLSPDFSQVEADELQFAVNNRFAVAATEKRPFFLENAELLMTGVPVVHTRAFTEPEVGVRVSHRSSEAEYTALLLRDAGGGTVVEPGPQASSAAEQDFSSTALVGRYRVLRERSTWGALTSLRINDDGSKNLVLGVDAHWAPSSSDRIAAQILWSETQEPQRPDLLDAWDGRRLAGAAANLWWSHTKASGYLSANLSSYSHSFRTWNGLLSQVGVSQTSLSSGLYFYPQNRLVTRISPALYVSSVDELGGSGLGRVASPGISIEGARETYLSLWWSPNARSMTPLGWRSYDAWTASLSTTLFDWMPGLSVDLSGGEALNAVSGELGDAMSWQAQIPVVPFARLQVNLLLGHQSLHAKRRAGGRRMFSEYYAQLGALWSVSTRLHAHALYQTSRIALEDGAAPESLRFVTRSTTVLLSYEWSWQRRWYVGVRQQESFGTEIFAKLAYAL